MKEIILAKYGEIILKGGNRPKFEKMLIENIKDAMRKAPAEEEGGYKNKGKQVLPAYDL